MKAQILGTDNHCEYHVYFSDGRRPSWIYIDPPIVKKYKFYYVAKRVIESFYFGEILSVFTYGTYAYIPITQELIGDCKRVLSYSSLIERKEEMIAFVDALEELLNA